MARSWIRGASAVFVTLACVAAVAMPTKAEARAQSAPASYRYTAVAGSAAYLIYTRARLVGGEPVATGGLYELASSGARKRLATISSDDRDFSLSGSTLFTIAKVNGVQKVLLWNLRTGAESVRPRLDGSWFAVAAAPGGYLQESHTSTGTALEMVTLDGAVTSLGTPFQSQRGYNITVGSDYLVAYESDVEQPGGAKSEQFTKPGQFHTLLPVSAGAGATFCGTPDAAYVACRLGSIDSLRLYKLTGHEVAKIKEATNTDFLPAPAVLGHTAVWLATATTGQLRQLAATGAVTHSQRSFAKHVAPVTALNRVIVSNPPKTGLLELTAATAKPQLLV